MSQENINRLRASLESFNRTGQISVAMLAPEFEMQQASSIIDTKGSFRGQGALQASLDELRRSFEAVGLRE